MNKLLATTVLIMLTAIMGYSISNEEIRGIMDKSNPTVSDAAYLLLSIDKPDLKAAEISLGEYPRLAKIKMDASVTAGDFAIMAIELKKAKGGIIYNLTGWGKYAAESFVHQKIYPQYFSWNRDLSGQELIEFVTVLKNSGK